MIFLGCSTICVNADGIIVCRGALKEQLSNANSCIICSVSSAT